MDSAFPAAPSNEEVDDSLQCDPDTIRKAIMSFTPGSSAGRDLLEPQHLKDLISKSTGEDSRKLLEAIAALCNLILKGKVPDEVVPYIYGASLFALTKQNSDIRRGRQYLSTNCWQNRCSFC